MYFILPVGSGVVWRDGLSMRVSSKGREVRSPTATFENHPLAQAKFVRLLDLSGAWNYFAPLGWTHLARFSLVPISDNRLLACLPQSPSLSTFHSMDLQRYQPLRDCVYCGLGASARLSKILLSLH